MSVLKSIIESDGQVFLKHPVAMAFVAGAIVVEARMDEKFRRNVLVELEGERVFPFIFHTLVAGEAIHARTP